MVGAAGVVRFMGIPYGEPPVGDLRFRPPVARAGWTGEREAYVPGAAAPQPWIPEAVGLDVGRSAEDCLYLNVWTPDCDDSRRPVMVWLHSGGLILGAGHEPAYEGTTLAVENDIVVVTINHRLGVLGGFIYLNEFGQRFSESANVGLLDQWLALRWVQDNIETFGGDPRNVTLAGESAGGLGVIMAMCSASTRETYHRAVAMSPAPTRVLERDRALVITEAYLAALGNPSADELFSMSAEQLVSPTTEIHGAFRHGPDLLAFQPVIDSSVFSRQPLELLAAGVGAGAPTIVGTTRDELSAVIPGAAEDLGDEDALVEQVCDRCVDQLLVPRVRRAYSSAALKRAVPPPGSRPKAILQSDRVIRIGAIRTLEAQSHNQVSTFAYMFGWEATHGFGATHQIDIPFLFGTLATPGYVDLVAEPSAASRLSEKFRASIVHFMRHGRPGDDLGVAWPAYVLPRRATMFVRADSSVIDDPWDEQREAWNGYPIPTGGSSHGG